jgi:hypothetical protein
VTLRVGCVACGALRDVDVRELAQRDSWPLCCGRPMVARTLRALVRPRPEDER